MVDFPGGRTKTCICAIKYSRQFIVDSSGVYVVISFFIFIDLVSRKFKLSVESKDGVSHE